MLGPSTCFFPDYLDPPTCTNVSVLRKCDPSIKVKHGAGSGLEVCT